MFFNRNNCCGCGNCNSCCNPCGCGCAPIRPVQPLSYVCYCSRYVDMPMNVYYGSGYTEIDCCEDTLEVLQEISNTLKQNNRGRGCGCCGGCGGCR